MIIQFSHPALFVEKTLLSPSNDFGTHVRNQLAVDVYVIYFWTLSSILLSVCQYHPVSITVLL